MAVAVVVHQAVDSYSDIAAVVAVETIDDCPIVAVSEAAVLHVLESHLLNTLPTDVLKFDSIVAPVVQLDCVARTVAPVMTTAIELNPIGRHSIVMRRDGKKERFDHYYNGKATNENGIN